jgi:hypothetical protein
MPPDALEKRLWGTETGSGFVADKYEVIVEKGKKVSRGRPSGWLGNWEFPSSCGSKMGIFPLSTATSKRVLWRSGYLTHRGVLNRRLHSLASRIKLVVAPLKPERRRTFLPEDAQWITWIK